MCGIAGFTHLKAHRDRDLIRNLTAALRHRGPDQQGVWESDSISLGAVRLKIIDLDGGDQPLASEDGGSIIVFNGEIYNHAELRLELEGRGHRFASRCDTEVVLRAFLEWDTACFSRLHGMFAAGLWNESRKRLVLARDRMGIKPLYLHRRGREIYFGSELKAILEHPEVERNIDHDALSCYLSLNWVPGPRTLVAGIEKLSPGHWLEWREGDVRTEAYWTLEMRPQARTLESAKEELDSLLRRSVREHLVSDVPLGIWASGGLDSTTVLHYAAEAAPERLKTFSVSFQGQGFDESPYFREVAARYATDHHEFDLNPDVELTSAVEEIAYYSDEPSADAGALPVWFLARMSRQHVTVALSGEGADELFGGYNTYLADSYSSAMRAVPWGARSLALRLLRHWPVSDEKVSLEYKLKRFLEGSLLPADEAHLFWNGTFTAADKRHFYSRDNHDRVRELGRNLPEQAARAGRLSRYLWLDQLYYLPDDILYKCDRMSMAHSLEVRPPFLDHRIVEFAASLPENLKVRGSRLKFLLRELMRDKLPAAVLERKKEGFDIPAHAWFRTVLRPLLLDTLSEETIERSGLFESREIQRLMHAHLDRRANLGYHLWGLVTLFLWMKRWKIQTPRLDPARHETPASLSVTN